MYAKNGRSVMAKDFGPGIWNVLSHHFMKALKAYDEDGFLVSASSLLNLCGLLCALYSHFVAYSYQRHIDDALAAAGND